MLNESLALEVYYNDMTYEETDENFSYGIVSLLCDIGGTMGLLLGASGNIEMIPLIQFNHFIQSFNNWIY